MHIFHSSDSPAKKKCRVWMSTHPHSAKYVRAHWWCCLYYETGDKAFQINVYFLSFDSPVKKKCRVSMPDHPMQWTWQSGVRWACNFHTQNLFHVSSYILNILCTFQVPIYVHKDIVSTDAVRPVVVPPQETEVATNGSIAHNMDVWVLILLFIVRSIVQSIILYI